MTSNQAADFGCRYCNSLCRQTIFVACLSDISLMTWRHRVNRHMMFTTCLPQHYQNPTRTNRSSGLIRNSYLLNKQMIIDNSCLCLAIHKMKGSHLFWLSRSKGMTFDIWIRDYNPQRCFQKKISGRSKHNAKCLTMLVYYPEMPVGKMEYFGRMSKCYENWHELSSAQKRCCLLS
jgi:hypothetical protein